MIIRKEICKERAVANGMWDVMIMIRHKGKVKRLSTGVRCRKQHWMANEERISKLDPDYRIKNEMVDMMFRSLSGEIQSHIDDFLNREFERIVGNHKSMETEKGKSPDEQISGEGDQNYNLASLVREKMKTLSRLNTRRGYVSFLRLVENRFNGGAELGDVDSNYLGGLIADIDYIYKEKQPMRREMLSKLKSVLNFGIETGRIRNEVRPRFPKVYLDHKDRNLDDRVLSSLFSRYREFVDNYGIIDQQIKSWGIFFLGIAFQGLAPSDLARLRLRDIKTKMLIIDGNEECFIVVKTHRVKTGVPVNIVAWRNPVVEILQSLMQRKNDDEYLLDCFAKDEILTEAQMQNRLCYYFGKISRSLLLPIGKERETHQITYYYARHAFCNIVDGLDLPRNVIQKMVGHRLSVLERSYLRGITEEEQAKVSVRVFRKLGFS